MWPITKPIIGLAVSAALMTAFAIAAGTGPTEQSALAADDNISHALLANDTKTLRGLLADDWIVVSAKAATTDATTFSKRSTPAYGRTPR